MVLDRDRAGDYYVMVSECYMRDGNTVDSYGSIPVVICERSPASFIRMATMVFECLFYPTLFWDGQRMVVASEPAIDDPDLLRMARRAIRLCHDNDADVGFDPGVLVSPGKIRIDDGPAPFLSGNYVIQVGLDLFSDSYRQDTYHSRIFSYEPGRLVSSLYEIPIMFEKHVRYSRDGIIIDSGSSLIDMSGMDDEARAAVTELVDRMKEGTRRPLPVRSEEKRAAAGMEGRLDRRQAYL